MTIGARAFSKKLSQKEIQSLVEVSLEQMLQVVSPEKIILFGSAMGDEFDDASDLDFVLVFKTQDEVRLARKVLYQLKRKVTRPHDFLCLDQEAFDKKKDIGGIFFVAQHEGRVIYERGT